MNFNSFELHLFNKLCESTDEDKNIFISPLSISLALSMLLLGCNGATRQQLEKALGVVRDEKILGQLKALNEELDFNSKGLQLELANSVSTSETFQMIAKYKSDMENAFKSQM